MSEIIAVIGSGYGDEGKGLMTDFYASRNPDALVIRANGGAQAGHTVCTPNGDRHVFSHFGSGTLAGNPTFLSDPFVVNPLLFYDEWKQLMILTDGRMPKIYIDEQCMVTTPFDMLINQKMETMRGEDPHGSVGVGFGETIQRCQDHVDVSIGNCAYADSHHDAFMWLNEIRKDYVPTRIDLSAVSNTFNEVLYNDELIDNYLTALDFMLEHVEVIGLLDLVDKLSLKDRPMIFEGAQGLLLDMNYGFFPHVTRSNCGMKNISEVIDNIDGDHNITVNYVTRAYSTRHGAGPLDFEDSTITQRHNIVDDTNMYNEWQHSLRFAPLNIDLYDSVTAKDFALHAPKGAKNISTITCMDQLSEHDVTVVERGKIRYFSRDVFHQISDQRFNIKSFGPTRDDVIDAT